MKGLLLKDFYVLWKQARVLLLLMLAFTVLPGMSAFVILYAAMLPYTALAYDEQAKWDTLAAMLPYRTHELVLSKYLLGYFAIGAATLVTLLAKIILQRTAELFGVVLPLVSVALLMMALLLPPMLRFGVEKARLFFLLFVCSMAAASAGITARFAVSEMALPASLALGLPLLALVGNAVSIALSLRLYPRRSF